MITINDTDGHPLAQDPGTRGITSRCETTQVDRVDVYPHPEGPALLAVKWTDGSKCVCDWSSARVCLDWLRSQAWAEGVTEVHFPRGASAVPLAEVAA